MKKTFSYTLLSAFLFISCSKEELSNTELYPTFNSDTDIELVLINPDTNSYTPVLSSEMNTRSDVTTIKEKQSYSLKFNSMASLYQFIDENNEDPSIVSLNVKKRHSNFSSILDIFSEAMVWADKYLDETQESYDTWKQLYGDYLYFPEYKEDYGAYIPISIQSVAALSDINGRIVIGNQIVNMKDIFTYEDLQLKGKDAYYNLEEKGFVLAANPTCHHHYQLVGNYDNCKDEYDSGWTEKNSRKLRVKVGRQVGANKRRIHIEISFRKKTIFGWGNYSSRTESEFTFNGSTQLLVKEEDSSHDFYITDVTGIGDSYPTKVRYCDRLSDAPSWYSYHVNPQNWSISIYFRGFGDDKYRVKKSDTIPYMIFYRPS